ncbi:MAG: ferredoxin--NADP reductase [Myxococcota bacterium]
MPADFHELHISGIIQETHDTRSFIFEVPDALRSAFSYRAGQFLTFEVPWNGMQLRRSYSLSSAPETDPWPKVTVKRVAEGRVSNWFNDQLSVGDTILVQPPEGRFVLRTDEADHGVFLFGGGSGITPVISILKAALRTTSRRVKLVYANRDARSIIFKDELDLWIREFPDRLEVVHHLDTDHGFMDINEVKTHFAGWEKAEFFVCGPTGYMDTVEEAFKSGIDLERTKFERFLSPVDPDRRDESSAVAEPELLDGEVPTSFTIVLEGQTHEVPYEKGKTLLESAVEAGHRPPSSCEDGYCGCCMALLKRGDVSMATHDALEPSDIERGWILACQARPSSQVQLEIDFDAQY